MSYTNEIQHVLSCPLRAVSTEVDTLVGISQSSKGPSAQSKRNYYNKNFTIAFHTTYSLQMRSAYDAIVLGTENSVLNPEGLFVAMRHQCEILMVSVIYTLIAHALCSQ